MTESIHPLRNWRRWDLAAFSALVLLHFLAFSRMLIYPDLIFSYPFTGGDSPDWIANALFLAGHDVTYTARPPLLPVLLAALNRLALLDFYPLLAQFLAHSTICGLYGLLRLDYSKLIAGIVATAWLMNTTWLKLSLPLMADVPAACLLFWCVFFWRRSDHAQAGLLGGLSAVTQPVALVLAAPVLLTLILFRRQDLTCRRFLVGGLLFVAPTGLWLLFKKALVGQLGDVSSLRHWSLLIPHLDSVGYYAYAAGAFVGPIAMVGILLGSLSFLRRARRDPWCFFLLAVIATILAFFVLLYNFNSLRFLAYVFPLSAVLLAEGLHRLPRFGKRLLLPAVLIWAIIPAPSSAPDPTRVTLWPLPPTYLKAVARDAGAGSWSINPLSARIETRSLSDLTRYHPYGVVADSHRLHRTERWQRQLSPHVVRNEAWAVYFYDDLAQAGTGYGFATRLGNLLTKRVHYLPSSAFGGAWERLLFQQLGSLDGQTVFRARIPGRQGSWVVLTRTGGKAEKRVLAAISDTSQPDSDLLLAEEVAPHLTDRSVAILAPASGLEPWQIYLPFVAHMRQFLITEHQREVGTRRMLGPGRLVAEWEPVAERKTVTKRRNVVLREHQVFGRPWIVIE